MKKKMSRAAAIRLAVLLHGGPTAAVDDVRTWYTTHRGVPPEKFKQMVYQAKSDVKRRLGKDYAEKLEKRGTSLNLSKFYRDFYPGKSWQEANRSAGYFGLEITHSVYQNANGTSKPKKPKTTTTTLVLRSQTDVPYREIEETLDGLIQQAQALGNHELVEELKIARRTAGIKIKEVA